MENETCGRTVVGRRIDCHLSAVERAILSRTDKLLQKPPKPAPFYERLHVPMILVEARAIRRKAPTPVEPRMVGEKEEMLAELRQVRERTLAFIEEIMDRDLSKYCMPDAFLGTLNGYEWLQFLASHEIRHTKQMREIAVSLPKTVTSLDK
jgi:DinB superfamily